MDANARTKTSELFKAYQAWCEKNGERAEKTREFGKSLKKRGLEPNRTKTARFYLGIKITRGDMGDMGDMKTVNTSRESAAQGNYTASMSPMSPYSPEANNNAALQGDMKKKDAVDMSPTIGKVSLSKIITESLSQNNNY